MEKDWIDILLSILMISFLFFLFKLIGYWIEKLLVKKTKEVDIEGIKVRVLESFTESILLGSEKQFTLHQMTIIVNHFKNYKRIKFAIGKTTLFSRDYALYENKEIRYTDTGKTVKIENDY